MYSIKKIYMIITTYFMQFVPEQNVLIIRNADGSDSGEYNCSAENAFSSSFSVININVEGEIRIIFTFG